jgi:ABC-type Fe3+ transport system permease subunit
MSQRSRRRDPYPWMWEIPTCVVVAILLVMVCGVHLGRAIANVVAGADWVLTERADLFKSLPAVLQGDAGAGIDGPDGLISSSTSLWTCIAATELMLLTVCVVLLKQFLDRWGPARMKGMANRAEAERMLGITRLRRVRAIVRPDLYGNRRSEPQDDHETG